MVSLSILITLGTIVLAAKETRREVLVIIILNYTTIETQGFKLTLSTIHLRGKSEILKKEPQLLELVWEKGK